jgi:hypothetical protein
MRQRLPDTRGERATKAVLAAMAEGRMNGGRDTNGLQVGSVLDLIGKAMLAGVVLLAIFAVGQPAVLATLTLGLFAASASAAAGAALGFLFALPSSAGRVVVAPAPAPAANGGDATEAADGQSAQAAATREIEDWFRDNTALERLSDWLVGAIIALSLANFEAWRLRLQTLAVDVTKGMGLTGGDWGAPAGVIMAAYALMGFLGGYLWTRRYMVSELARARAEARDVQRRSEFPAAEAERLMHEGQVGAAVSGVNVLAQAQAAIESKQHPVEVPAGLESTQAVEWPPLISPGWHSDDPWAGQFGGQAAGDGLELAALVRPVAGKTDLFGVDITVTGRPGGQARLYLHPTFPDPIRELALDATGRATQRLLAWGAFTVGVQFDTGQLRELNLATLPGAPERFRTR